MDTPFEDIAFLANSANRVAIFETIVEGPKSRAEIRDQVDASGATITRVLRGLEERNWITSVGQEFEATPLGEWIYEEFTRLVGELEAERRLREPMQWLPSEQITFDAQHLRDAEILLVEETDVTGFFRRVREFQSSGDNIRGVTRGVSPDMVENQWELTVHGDAHVDFVISPAVLDVVLEHSIASRQFSEMLDQPNVRFTVCEEIPMSVAIVDGKVGINLTDEKGVLKGGLICENDVVREWAIDLFEGCRENGTTVDRSMLRRE
ncbi:helix-turn-helix transcriptional regulator [Haloferax sp. YSSS75]|uniref:helix-turn-helix transcriptional regulator n=1 Tax=Haloferax sp. YSSS75 TaxID=3388564 RepID=UPI00398CEE7E